MYQYQFDTGLLPLSGKPDRDAHILTLLTSRELEQAPPIPGMERLLRHTPAARDARVCKAEAHRNYLCGSIVTPRRTKNQEPISFGYLLTAQEVILCDDSGAAHTIIQYLSREEPRLAGTPAGFLYTFLERLLAKDMHHLQELEARLEQTETQALAGHLEGLNLQMSSIRKELMGWLRYYTQLDDMICEFLENENAIFTEEDLRLFRLVEKRVNRLERQTSSLREYGLQVRELFQAEIDIRQNRIMKILTIVTTIFLPLSLVAGWYGMNFAYMPELSWKYGYPAVIVVSALVILICLWIMKKKRFW